MAGSGDAEVLPATPKRDVAFGVGARSRIESYGISLFPRYTVTTSIVSVKPVA